MSIARRRSTSQNYGFYTDNLTGESAPSPPRTLRPQSLGLLAGEKIFAQVFAWGGKIGYKAVYETADILKGKDRFVRGADRCGHS